MTEAAAVYTPTSSVSAAPEAPAQRPRKSLSDRVQELMDRRGMTQKHLADETGLSRSVVSEWLAGKYAHAGDVVPAMKAWVERVTHGDDEFVFVDLLNSKRVMEACEFAMRERRIALVVGRPGLGKTVALKEWYERQMRAGVEVVYHFTSPAIKQHSLAKMLARRFELSERGTTHDLLEAVVGKMRRRPVPLVIDEANHLNVPCLESLRYVYDAVRMPLVLVGSVQLQRTLSERGDRYIELEQLQSRIGLRVILETLRPQDTRRILERHFSGAMHPDIEREFHSRSRGVVRDLVNGIESVKEIMRINKLSDLTPEVVVAAFERQLLA